MQFLLKELCGKRKEWAQRGNRVARHRSPPWQDATGDHDDDSFCAMPLLRLERLRNLARPHLVRLVRAPLATERRPDHSPTVLM